MTWRNLLPGLALIPCLIAPLRSQGFNAANELKLGIAAYEKAKYNEAITHLQRAVPLAPKEIQAHFYLAKAYNDSYLEADVWSKERERENSRLKMLAIQEYKEVLKLDPSNTEAMKSIAHRHLWSAEYDQAESYYRKTIEADPNDAEALYTLSVLNWQRSYQPRQEKRYELKLKGNEPLIGRSACYEIRAENLARVEEALAFLARSMQVFKSLDSMEYMGLLYRERADIQCGAPAAHDEDRKTALEWTTRACEARRKPDRILVPSRWPSGPPPPVPKYPNTCLFE